DAINPYLDLASSPFYVQSSTEEWKLSSQTKVQLRRAGISSFGATGSNAHVILEEFPREEAIVRTEIPGGVLLPLSAKNHERLKELAGRIRYYLEANPETDLLSLAQTLQTGRVALEERLILLVKSIEEAREKLAEWFEVPNSSPNVWQGVVKSSGKSSRLFDGDEDLQEAISQWIKKGKLKKLAELWIEGHSMNWQSLYQNETLQRLHLPTYPFSRERYWIADTRRNGINATAGTSVSVIHPLLHENTSDLSEQRFTSTFTGKEFFLAGHIIKGKKVFPGVCYLEMARAAVEKASEQVEEGMVICLRNIVWIQPVVVDKSSKEVHIGLFGEEKGQIQYEVYTESENEEEAIVHFQGIAEFKLKQETPVLDVHALQSQMNQGILNAEICYKAYNKMGAEGNERFGGVQQIYQGENQVLAELRLPYSNQDTGGEYVLEPCLMNAAISSLIGLDLKNGTLNDNSETSLKMSLPFTLESLEIFYPCTSLMYAWVRHSGSGTMLDKVQKYDIDLCDEQGTVCVEMR
ncbi:MAG: type I polyketide synthase, partial [Candidatus Brocadiaceae bacterium]|nr:type I polyketide synthase [Candidatus Brocadiaceae bacterium]